MGEKNKIKHSWRNKELWHCQVWCSTGKYWKVILEPNQDLELDYFISTAVNWILTYM